MKNWAVGWTEKQEVTSVKCARAHYGLRSATASLRPMCWSCALLGQSRLYGEFEELMLFLMKRLWFFLMKKKCTGMFAPAGMVQSAELRLWVVRTRTTSKHDRLHRLGRADLRRKRESGGARFHENNTHL